MSSKRSGLMLILVSFIGVMNGCGSDPGGELAIGDIEQTQLPISGVSQKMSEAYGLLRNGAFTQARDLFNLIISDNPTTEQRGQAQAGAGFSDVRLRGSQDGIREFELALEADPRNPEARVGLAGALVSRGNSLDLERARELLEGLDPGNPNFIFADRFGLGIPNAEVHALLAYVLFVTGRQADAEVQAGIARRLDPSFATTNVGKILDVISFIP